MSAFTGFFVLSQFPTGFTNSMGSTFTTHARYAAPTHTGELTHGTEGRGFQERERENMYADMCAVGWGVVITDVDHFHQFGFSE